MEVAKKIRDTMLNHGYKCEIRENYSGRFMEDTATTIGLVVDSQSEFETGVRLVISELKETDKNLNLNDFVKLDTCTDNLIQYIVY